MTTHTLPPAGFSAHPDACLFLSLFACGYTGIMLALGWASGWWRLAKHYRRASQKDAGWHHAFVAWVGPVRYANVIGVGATAEGMFLEPYLPWRIGHPPLFFPWIDISIEPARSLFGPRYQFSFAKVPFVVVELAGSLGDKILAEAARRGATNLPVVE
jgi:hypothetical protein